MIYMENNSHVPVTTNQINQMIHGISWDDSQASSRLFQNRGRAICSFGDKDMKRHTTGRCEFLHQGPEN